MLNLVDVSDSLLHGQRLLIKRKLEKNYCKIINGAEEPNEISSCWMSQSKEAASTTNLSEEDYKHDDACLASLEPVPRLQQQQLQTHSHLSSHGCENILALSKVDRVRDERVVPKKFQAQQEKGESDNANLDIDSSPYKQRQDSGLHPNLSFPSVPARIHDAATLCQELEDDDVNDRIKSLEIRQQMSTAESKLAPTPLVVSNDISQSYKEGGLLRHIHHKSNNNQEKCIQELNQNQSEAITEPSKFDIVCGQSKNLNNRPGNRRFQVILDMYTPKYRNTTNRQERMLITKEIIACIHSSGGRFLKKNSKGFYEEISSVMARDKVSHALRNRI